jgi:hypothetical protein
MTTATTTDLELLRTRVSGAIGRRMPEHIARLGWDAGQLAARPRVGFRRVGALDRDPMTSKARRFIPLSARIP